MHSPYEKALRKTFTWLWHCVSASTSCMLYKLLSTGNRSAFKEISKFLNPFSNLVDFKLLLKLDLTCSLKVFGNNSFSLHDVKHTEININNVNNFFI